MLDFSGREAVVTGGTGALGTAVVEHLVEAGAIVHVPVFISKELDEFPFREHPGVRIHEGLDLALEADVERLYASPSSLYTSIHVAGGFAMGPIADTELETWNRLLRMNATTCFLCCRQAARSMNGRPGRIVNVAARPALVPTAQMSAYAASKSAVAALTLALSEELAQAEVWVNAVVPSIIDTPANRAAMPDANHEAWPTPADIARTIAFLGSPQNASTRGALVPVYGKS